MKLPVNIQKRPQTNAWTGVRSSVSSIGLRARARQAGLVLIMVLIVLVAMMFAGIAMVRSVDTASLIAGNVAFRQAATHQGDFGIEAAVAWLQTNNTASSTVLRSNVISQGYFAAINGPSSTQTWDTYWHQQLDTNPVARPVLSTSVNSGSVVTLQTSGGYTVSYVIHRLCPAPGITGCLNSPTPSVGGENSNKIGLGTPPTAASTVYYRITAKIEGPRNTVSYVQEMVAM